MSPTTKRGVTLPPLTLTQALNLQSACMWAATHYEKTAEFYPDGDDLRSYYEKRVKECQEGAELLRQAIVNPQWQAQLNLIHDISHNHWSD